MKVYMVYGERDCEFVEIAGIYDTEEKAIKSTDIMNGFDNGDTNYYYFDYEVE